MDGWHVALISVAIPAVITAGLPYLSSWAKRRQVRRLSDHEFGLKIRDELREDNKAMRSRIEALERENDDLQTRVKRLEAENGTHVGRITRLEDALRRHGHHDELEGMA